MIPIRLLVLLVAGCSGAAQDTPAPAVPSSTPSSQPVAQEEPSGDRLAPEDVIQISEHLLSDQPYVVYLDTGAVLFAEYVEYAEGNGRDVTFVALVKPTAERIDQDSDGDKKKAAAWLANKLEGRRVQRVAATAWPDGADKVTVGAVTMTAEGTATRSDGRSVDLSDRLSAGDEFGFRINKVFLHDAFLAVETRELTPADQSVSVHVVWPTDWK